MKLFILIAFYSCVGFSQISMYNHFPTMTPVTSTDFLDDKLENISFAYSMRVLVSDYNGPLIKLRKGASDTKDFYAGTNDIVDVTAIDTWADGASVYVDTWYDQSGQERHATQSNTTLQPEFKKDEKDSSSMPYPYLQGDANNDYLEVTNGNIQNVTDSGANGTILAILKASSHNSYSFGVVNSLNRWSAHINWGDNILYFDPGSCCGANDNRWVANSDNVNKWQQYTLMRTTNKNIIRIRGVEKLNEDFSGNCTLTLNFRLCSANGSPYSSSRTSFREFIMYKTNVSSSIFNDVENNQITFWSIP